MPPTEAELPVAIQPGDAARPRRLNPAVRLVGLLCVCLLGAGSYLACGGSSPALCTSSTCPNVSGTYWEVSPVPAMTPPCVTPAGDKYSLAWVDSSCTSGVEAPVIVQQNGSSISIQPAWLAKPITGTISTDGTVQIPADGGQPLEYDFIIEGIGAPILQELSLQGTFNFTAFTADGGNPVGTADFKGNWNVSDPLGGCSESPTTIWQFGPLPTQKGNIQTACIWGG